MARVDAQNGIRHFDGKNPVLSLTNFTNNFHAPSIGYISQTAEINKFNCES